MTHLTYLLRISVESHWPGSGDGQSEIQIVQHDNCVCVCAPINSAKQSPQTYIFDVNALAAQRYCMTWPWLVVAFIGCFG